MRPEAVEYILDNFEGQLLKALDSLGGELDRMHRRKVELEREVSNLAHVVAQGDFSTLRAALVDREREIGEITAKLLDIRAIVNSDVAQTRAILARPIDGITLTPTGEHYVANGTWDFLGRGSIGGAGGPACTILPRADFVIEVAA
jgi:hypothetical protein